MVSGFFEWSLVVFTSFIWSYWCTAAVKTSNENLGVILVILLVTVSYFLFDSSRITTIDSRRKIHAFCIFNFFAAYFLYMVVQKPVVNYVLGVGLTSIFANQISPTCNVIAGLLWIPLVMTLLLLSDSTSAQETLSGITWPSFTLLTFIHLHFCNLVYYKSDLKNWFNLLHYISATFVSMWLLPKLVSNSLLVNHHNQNHGLFLVIAFAEILTLVSLDTLKHTSVRLESLHLITVTSTTLGIFLAVHSFTTNFVFLLAVVIGILIDGYSDLLTFFSQT